MSAESYLLSAIGTLVTVIGVLSAVVRYLYRELRAESRGRAKDSELFLTTLARLRERRSERPPSEHPDIHERRSERQTPSETPSMLRGDYSYSTRTRTSQTRR